ncbi:maleylacetoacetate isomerase [Rhodobacteraceae bacterium RKSG542]|uniref:maleylacetoacetate isomerase n=1 Tax=Pseudovibrio flavus TaxID=2529854 RepID=UPI0012BC449B|nr:maleylacetoacetate isomerase [Pseudovibrio flavus]MTI16149.1 maleylacetoacetate isomerase [Pseudovibrio flavus]
MSTAVLYDYWRSSASYRVRIGLNHKGISYDAVKVDLLSGEHRGAEHLARNPQGLVPVLEIDGKRFSQSLAILEYLDEVQPQPAFLPEDAEGKARVRQLAHAIAMDIHPVCNLGVVKRVQELAGGDDAVKVSWMKEFMSKGLLAFEELLNTPQTGQFCYGDEVSLADICLVPQMYNARRWGVDLSKMRKLTAIADRAAELPAFKAAYPSD